jgi:hypothetical protein
MKSNTSPISSNEKKTKSSNDNKHPLKKRTHAQMHAAASPKYTENQVPNNKENQEKHQGVSSSSVSQKEFSSPSLYPFLTKPSTPAKNTSSKALYYDNERQK